MRTNLEVIRPIKDCRHALRFLWVSRPPGRCRQRDPRHKPLGASASPTVKDERGEQPPQVGQFERPTTSSEFNSTGRNDVRGNLPQDGFLDRDLVGRKIP